MIRFSKRLLLTSAFLALFSPYGFAATAAKDAPKATAANPSPSEIIIARVNGKNITKENLDVATNNLLPLMTYHNAVSGEKMKDIEKKALEKLINNELMYKAAKDLKQDEVKQKEIDDQVKELKKRLPKGETLAKVLKRSNMTEADLKDDFKRDIVVARIARKKGEELRKLSDSNVNEAYMKDYYQKNLNKFKEPEQIHIRTILVKADPSGGQRVWNESLKKAKDALASIKGGQDFAKVAEKTSEDPFAKKGGDMGWAHKGSLLAEIDEATSKLKVGEISDPVATIYGYHIIKLEGRKPPVQKKFEELNKEKLKKELEAKEYKKLWEGWLKGLHDTSKVEILQPL